MKKQSSGPAKFPSGSRNDKSNLRSAGRQSAASGSKTTRAASANKKGPVRARGQRKAATVGSNDY